MKSRKLTTHQAEMVVRLLAANGDVTIPHSIYKQDARTANSLRRRFGITVTRVTKLPGARFSYGYRALRLQVQTQTLERMRSELEGVQS